MSSKILLVLAGLVFIAVGVTSLISPQASVDPLGLQLATVDSLNEIRANYGGMHLFLGLFMAGAVFNSAWQLSALRIVALFTGGLVLGRLLSLVVDGMPGNILWAFLVLEAVGCMWALALLRGPSRSKLAE